LKYLARSLSLLALWAACASGEEATVYACDGEFMEIPRAALLHPPEPSERETKLMVHHISKEVGKIETGELDLEGMAKRAAAYDQSADPFFGPGFEFILRDAKGKHFILFFEYEKDHKTFSGGRAALAPLNDLGSKGAVFVGDPFQGVTFDKALMKQLKALADSLPVVKEPAAGGEKKPE